MKILYVTTVGGTMRFFKDFVNELLEKGHTVDIATNEKTRMVPEYYREWGCKVHQISCTRSPFNKGSIKAIKEIKKLVDENNYDIVHCHTPIAAMCTRLACLKARKKGTKVFYTAHGFHFYKGAPLKNWVMYYPIEKICSYFTDVLITINREDYNLAESKFHAKKTEYVQGVGVDISPFISDHISKQEKRKEIGIPDDATLLISVGELNKNKNHETVIRAIKDLDVYYVIAGHGRLDNYLQTIIDELGLSKRVKLLGYRDDVAELYKAADICCFPSFREGLGLAAIEGMLSGLPLLAADNRGTREFCIDGKNGYVCNPSSVKDFADAISKFLSNENAYREMGKLNRENAKVFDVNVINQKMLNIYFLWK